MEALRSLPSKMKLSTEERNERHILSNEEKEKLIKDYVDRETAVARKLVQDTETAIMQEQEQMGTVEKVQSTTTKAKISFERILNAVADGLSDLASCEDEEDGETRMRLKQVQSLAC